MSQGVKICVIVLNWNNAGDTIECLESVFPSVQDGLTSVIVVDNASTDDSVERISEWAHDNMLVVTGPVTTREVESGKNGPDFRLVRTCANLGYAGGNNAGIRIALRDPDYSHIFILNNDTVLHRNALNELAEFAAANQECGVIGSTILYDAGSERVQCAGGSTYNPWTTILRGCYADIALTELPGKDDFASLDYISGAASLFRSDVLRKFGLLDERFFLYYEELDFSRRLLKSSYRLGWCKKSLVYHKGGAHGRALTETESHLRNYYENLSTLIFTKKHHALIFVIPAAFRFFGKSLTYVFSRNLYLFNSLLSAYKDFFLNKYGSHCCHSSVSVTTICTGNLG